jgi:hypothetical protein
MNPSAPHLDVLATLSQDRYTGHNLLTGIYSLLWRKPPQQQRWAKKKPFQPKPLSNPNQADQNSSANTTKPAVIPPILPESSAANDYPGLSLYLPHTIILAQNNKNTEKNVVYSPLCWYFSLNFNGSQQILKKNTAKTTEQLHNKIRRNFLKHINNADNHTNNSNNSQNNYGSRVFETLESQSLRSKYNIVAKLIQFSSASDPSVAISPYQVKYFNALELEEFLTKQVKLASENDGNCAAADSVCAAERRREDLRKQLYKDLHRDRLTKSFLPPHLLNTATDYSPNGSEKGHNSAENSPKVVAILQAFLPPAGEFNEIIKINWKARNSAKTNPKSPQNLLSATRVINQTPLHDYSAPNFSRCASPAEQNFPDSAQFDISWLESRVISGVLLDKLAEMAQKIAQHINFLSNGSAEPFLMSFSVKLGAKGEIFFLSMSRLVFLHEVQQQEIAKSLENNASLAYLGISSDLKQLKQENKPENIGSASNLNNKNNSTENDNAEDNSQGSAEDNDAAVPHRKSSKTVNFAAPADTAPISSKPSFGRSKTLEFSENSRFSRLGEAQSVSNWQSGVRASELPPEISENQGKCSSRRASLNLNNMPRPGIPSRRSSQLSQLDNRPSTAENLQTSPACAPPSSDSNQTLAWRNKINTLSYISKRIEPLEQLNPSTTAKLRALQLQTEIKNQKLMENQDIFKAVNPETPNNPQESKELGQNEETGAENANLDEVEQGTSSIRPLAVLMRGSGCSEFRGKLYCAGCELLCRAGSSTPCPIIDIIQNYESLARIYSSYNINAAIISAQKLGKSSKSRQEGEEKTKKGGKKGKVDKKTVGAGQKSESSVEMSPAEAYDPRAIPPIIQFGFPSMLSAEYLHYKALPSFLQSTIDLCYDCYLLYRPILGTEKQFSSLIPCSNSLLSSHEIHSSAGEESAFNFQPNSTVIDDNYLVSLKLAKEIRLKAIAAAQNHNSLNNNTEIKGNSANFHKIVAKNDALIANLKGFSSRGKISKGSNRDSGSNGLRARPITAGIVNDRFKLMSGGGIGRSKQQSYSNVNTENSLIRAMQLKLVDPLYSQLTSNRNNSLSNHESGLPYEQLKHSFGIENKPHWDSTRRVIQSR